MTWARRSNANPHSPAPSMSSDNQRRTDGAVHPVTTREVKPSIASSTTTGMTNDRGAHVSLAGVAPTDRNTTEEPLRDDETEFGPCAYHEAPLSEQAHCRIVRKCGGRLQRLAQARTRGQGEHPKHNGHSAPRGLIADRLPTGQDANRGVSRCRTLSSAARTSGQREDGGHRQAGRSRMHLLHGFELSGFPGSPGLPGRRAVAEPATGPFVRWFVGCAR